MSGAFNLDVGTERERLDGNTCADLRIDKSASAGDSLEAEQDAYGLWVREELCVDFIHRSKVVHVRQKYIDFDCFGKTGTASLEDSTAGDISQQSISLDVTKVHFRYSQVTQNLLLY